MNENGNSEEIDRNCQEQVQIHHITAYKIAAGDDELQIKMLGKKELITTSNLPDYIAGTIKIDNMYIPVIDPKVKRGQKAQEITDNSSCVVLTALHGGRHGVTTAAIYPDLKRVLEFIMKQTKR